MILTFVASDHEGLPILEEHKVVKEDDDFLYLMGPLKYKVFNYKIGETKIRIKSIYTTYTNRGWIFLRRSDALLRIQRLVQQERLKEELMIKKVVSMYARYDYLKQQKLGPKDWTT